ncbi:MAG: hypothetical protein LBM98_00610 [Oscillospiraceae bacterium]|nr:hypothetical protein [Oscillospiraceae bacterium]
MLRTCNALRIAGIPVLRKDGLGYALPCPGAMRRGNHPAPAGAPLHRGDEDGGLDGGYAECKSSATPQPPSNPYPLCGGVPPAGGGVVPPRRARRNPRPNLRL